jgi:hypothetical protein
MGGDQRGISKANLKKCLITASQFYTNTDSFLTSDQSTFLKMSDNEINAEVDDIINLLSNESKDYLSIKDFTNIMTSNCPFPYEGFDFIN